MLLKYYDNWLCDVCVDLILVMEVVWWGGYWELCDNCYIGRVFEV